MLTYVDRGPHTIFAGAGVSRYLVPIFAVVGIVAGGFYVGSHVWVPRVACIEGDSLDFGTVPTGHTLESAFTLSNDGWTPLQLSIEKIHCLCTNVDLDKKTVAPGDTAHLRFDFTTDETPGYFTTGFVLRTNDPKRPTLDLTVQANAQLYVELTEGSFLFHEIDRSKLPLAREVRLEKREGAGSGPLSMEEASSPFPFFDLQIREAKPDYVRLSGTLSDNTPSGLHCGYALLRFPGAYQARIPVQLDVRGVYRARPTSLFFEDIPKGVHDVKRVEIVGPELSTAMVHIRPDPELETLFDFTVKPQNDDSVILEVTPSMKKMWSGVLMGAVECEIIGGTNEVLSIPIKAVSRAEP